MIKKYNWIALAFFICFIFLFVSFFFQKENEQCMTDFDKVDFKNLTDVDKFLLIDEIRNCIEDPEKKLQMLRKID
ncbi:hypothetical protein N9S62_03400 [Pelagibacteraceae bacterium]|jgi:hypothetical protein|nr:hypothetical protein [Pelagibacteraceae bacterium]MDC0628238.1 hypothetical protein [Pelagibacteraceae bacterium]